MLNTSGHATTRFTNFPITSRFVSELHTQTLTICPETEVVRPFSPRKLQTQLLQNDLLPFYRSHFRHLHSSSAETQTHTHMCAHAGISLQRLPQVAVKLVTRFEFVILKYFVCIKVTNKMLAVF